MTTKTFKDLEVGDEIFLVENDRRHCNPRYVKVVKVGRKFIHLQTNTYSMQKAESWNHDGYAMAISQDFPHCKLFATKEDYEEQQAWHRVREVMGSLSASTAINRSTRAKIIALLKEPLNL